MHDIILNPEEAEEENAYCCEVLGEIENPFSYSVMLRPEGTDGDRYILIDMKKSKWNRMRSDHLNVIIPRDRILLLK